MKRGITRIVKLSASKNASKKMLRISRPVKDLAFLKKLVPTKLAFMATNMSNVSSRASSGRSSPVNQRPKVNKKTMKAIIGSRRMHLRNRRLMAH